MRRPPLEFADHGGAASPTTVLRGEVAADFSRKGVLSQCDGTEEAIELCERMIDGRGPTLEDSVAVFARHDDRVSSIGRRSRAPARGEPPAPPRSSEGNHPRLNGR